MRKHNHIQLFAAFIDKKADNLPPFERCNQLIDCYHSEIKKNKDRISHCISYEEIDSALKNNKTAALLSIEGGEALSGDIDNLKLFYDKGVRLMTLCWNYENEICDGIGERRGRGLTEFGKAVVNEMHRLGMIIDVSHISEKGFWDIIDIAQAPISATHSDVFKLKDHKRNLNDEQIKAIIKNNGCIGINLYSEFLSSEPCKISDVIRHIEYILALGGENNIGIGCDFDGMDSLPKEISGIEDVEKIPDTLLSLGYSEELVKKITHKNFLRLIKQVL
jgi:membrane dipeptidase